MINFVMLALIFFKTERRAKLPEGADPKTMLPRKTLVRRKRLIVALVLPVCLSDLLVFFLFYNLYFAGSDSILSVRDISPGL